MKPVFSSFLPRFSLSIPIVSKERDALRSSLAECRELTIQLQAALDKADLENEEQLRRIMELEEAVARYRRRAGITTKGGSGESA